MTEPVPAPHVRVSDAERSLVETRLRQAVEVGQLELRDFDQRAALTWAARTRSDLDALTSDLGAPPSAAPVAPAVPRSRSTALDTYFDDTRAGQVMKVLVLVWLCTFVAAVAACIAVGVVNPGQVPLWPAWWLPGGAVLGTLYGLGVGRPTDD
ncbi:DUF1707 domain-containing protein [Modestobacter sp. Leaf380]|uniref:DUF1707 SHOCT-like domain-containing protein n=1 Tax=Modestobacter sp. Leaf380 TaxID=1736356 RepID=UPI0006F23133|nr:DUF1707 domain-containing protein [Modestobacter sp. Leaf380]KQS63649.1 hypothetical protein ASG41_18600 [Modestobacter sp. Leaf380]